MIRIIDSGDEIEDRITDLQKFEININKKADRAKIFRIKKQKPPKKIPGSFVDDLEKFEKRLVSRTLETKETFFFSGNR